MMLKRLLQLIAVCSLCSGCAGIYWEASRNLVFSPSHYCDRIYNTVAPCLYKLWAHKAWSDIKCQPGIPTSKHFKHGFIKGYVDYLDIGGKGDPPPLPPRKYWRKHYQTPAGHQAIEEWYAGFRIGAEVAKASGYREYVTIPSSIYEPVVIAKDEVLEAPSEDVEESYPGQEPLDPLPNPVPDQEEPPIGSVVPIPHTQHASGAVFLSTMPRDLNPMITHHPQTSVPARPMIVPATYIPTQLQQRKVVPATPQSGITPLGDQIVDSTNQRATKNPYVPTQSTVSVVTPATQEPIASRPYPVSSGVPHLVPKPLPFGPIPMPAYRENQEQRQTKPTDGKTAPASRGEVYPRLFRGSPLNRSLSYQ